MYTLLGFIIGLLGILAIEGIVIRHIVVRPRKLQIQPPRPKPEQTRKTLDAVHDLRTLHDGLEKETCCWMDSALAKAWCSLRDSDPWSAWIRDKIERKLRDIRRKPLGIFLDNFKLVDITYGETPPMLNNMIVIPNAKDKVVTMVGELQFTGKFSLSLTCDLPMHVPIAASLVIHELSGRVVIEFKRTKYSVFSYGFLDPPTIKVEGCASLGGLELPFLGRLVEKLVVYSLVKKMMLPGMKTKWLIRPKNSTLPSEVHQDALSDNITTMADVVSTLTEDTAIELQKLEDEKLSSFGSKEKTKIDKYLSITNHREMSLGDGFSASRSGYSSRRVSPQRLYSSWHIFKSLGSTRGVCDVCGLTAKDLIKCRACNFIAHLDCAQFSAVCAIVSAKQVHLEDKKRAKEEKKSKKLEQKGNRSTSMVQASPVRNITVTPSTIIESRSQDLTPMEDNNRELFTSHSAELPLFHANSEQNSATSEIDRQDGNRILPKAKEEVNLDKEDEDDSDDFDKPTPEEEIEDQHRADYEKLLDLEDAEPSETTESEESESKSIKSKKSLS